MAFEEDDKTTVFPTRFGTPTGAANERTMLTEVGGAQSIRTRIREGAYGIRAYLKTRAGMPRFWNEPAETPPEEKKPDVYMDSGVVDLISVNPNRPDSLKDAPLFYSTIQKGYYAAKRLLGLINTSTLSTTSPPADGTAGESFKAKLDDILRTSRQDALVGLLFTKKDCAAKCPASMFTGKGRLYIQAQYGAKLKTWKWYVALESFPPRLVYENGVAFDINTGIYLDDQFNHWMISVRSDGVIVTQMRRADDVKPLVTELKRAVNAEDAEKIEAYILAYTYPTTNAFVVSVSGLPVPTMLGYGWKFNPRGDKADIIQHVLSYPTYTSTHFRLSINRDIAAYVPPSGDYATDEKARWSITMAVVEGPVSWKNSRFEESIASPVWYLSALEIFGYTSGGPVTSDAPIYCFYKQDGVLEVFRYNRTGGEYARRWSRTATPSAWGISCGWTSDSSIGMNATEYDQYGTFFTDGGSGEWRERDYNPSTTGFVCSSASSARAHQSYRYERRELGSKTFGEGIGGYDSYSGDYVNLTQNEYVSYTITLADGELATAGYGHEIENLVFVPTNPSGHYYHTYYTIEQTLHGLRYEDGSHEESYSTLILVPFYDAEAAYIYGNLNTRRTYDGWSGDHVGASGAWAYMLRHYQYDGIGGYYLTDTWVIGRAHSQSYETPNTDVSTHTNATHNSDELVAAALVTKAGAFDFSSPVSMAQFFSGDDYVPQVFHTSSAAVGAAAYGYGAKNLEGFPDIFESPPPFIGWA